MSKMVAASNTRYVASKVGIGDVSIMTARVQSVPSMGEYPTR